ncbi:MAG: 2-C-methyl-D-erythritol 2,4-cyclodiphosphate synthase [Planctomycetota bacterium]
MIRVGHGQDSHRFGDGPPDGSPHGRPLVVGGIAVDSDRGLVAHSDGDVLLHALVDALLGATGRGDIGDRFPDTDTAYDGVTSDTFVTAVLADVRADGWEIANIDATVSLQRPKLGPHKRVIADNVARLVGIDPRRVNVKAKTGEKVGPVGRGECLTADVVLLLEKSNTP